MTDTPTTAVTYRLQYGRRTLFESPSRRSLWVRLVVALWLLIVLGEVGLSLATNSPIAQGSYWHPATLWLSVCQGVASLGRIVCVPFMVKGYEIHIAWQTRWAAVLFGTGVLWWVLS